jgi:hypothetical protein
MRMWMIDPSLLCRKHLLGEHNEIHKHRHNFEKHHSVTGRIYPIVLIEPASMELRHEEVIKEMIARGYNHQSPYVQPNISHLPVDQQNVKVDRHYNLQDLCNRCVDCKQRILDNKTDLLSEEK